MSLLGSELRNVHFVAQSVQAMAQTFAGLEPRGVHVGFVVDNGAMGQVLLSFPPLCYSINTAPSGLLFTEGRTGKA